MLPVLKYTQDVYIKIIQNEQLMINKYRERGDREWDGWMASLTHSMDMSLSKLWEIVKGRRKGSRKLESRSPWGHKESDTTELLSTYIYTHDKICHFKYTI